MARTLNPDETHQQRMRQQALRLAQLTGRTPQNVQDLGYASAAANVARERGERGGLSRQQFEASKALPPMMQQSEVLPRHNAAVDQANKMIGSSPVASALNMPQVPRATSDDQTFVGDTASYQANLAAKALGVTPGNFPKARQSDPNRPLTGGSGSGSRTMAGQQANLMKVDAFKELGAAGRAAVDDAIRNRGQGQSPDDVLASARSSLDKVRQAQQPKQPKLPAGVPQSPGAQQPRSTGGSAIPKPQQFGERLSDRPDRDLTLQYFQTKAMAADRDNWGDMDEHDRMARGLEMARLEGFDVTGIPLPVPKGDPNTIRPRLISGQAYNTPRGPMIWDGTNFVSQ